MDIIENNMKISHIRYKTYSTYYWISCPIQNRKAYVIIAS